ncbi:MAG: hypothetical protein WBS54_08390 [Acidobacteriota bacterium]
MKLTRRALLEALNKDLEWEYAAAIHKEYGLRRALEDILLMEEEHKRDLLTVLRR